MKKLVLIFGLFFIPFGNFARAQTPDARDSIILESKTVYPGAHPGAASDTAAYFYLKMYITNKDTLTALTLSVQEASSSGGAYMTLAWPRNFNGTVSRLTSTLGGSVVLFTARYHGNSPDSILIAGVYDPLDYSTLELPNAVRKPFWEIKFDTVFNSPGTIEIDTARVMNLTVFNNFQGFEVPVNFVKAQITVMPKGDLNLDGVVNSVDAVEEAECVLLGNLPPMGQSGCDLNCDGRRSTADVIWELLAVFLARAFPC